jgi:hypothetical protein
VVSCAITQYYLIAEEELGQYCLMMCTSWQALSQWEDFIRFNGMLEANANPLLMNNEMFCHATMYPSLPISTNKAT